MTVRQAETSKARAERFVRNVLEDDDHADAIADESLEDWADRKGVRIEENPRCVSPETIEGGIVVATGQTKADLLERVKELEDENQELNDQLDQVTDKLEDLLDTVAPDESDEDADGEDGGEDGDDNGDNGDDEGEE